MSTRVVGVVADFHLYSLHQAMEPVVMSLEPWRYLRDLYVRVDARDLPRTLSLLEHTWREVAPELPFRHAFLDEVVERQYANEQRWGRIVRWGAGLALCLACLGALALASLAAVRRTREIGIRKALGATATDVVRLLTREFAWIGLVATVLAAPVAQYAGSRWLQTFAYPVDLGVGPFLLAGTVVVGGTLLVVGAQAARASQRKPVDALRCE